MAAVLVVDDEPASRRAVQRALAEECEVADAAGGPAALALLADRPIAVLIADQRMPDMLGTELLAACADRFPATMRVLLTGYTDVDTLIDAINAGHVYAYLTKPWEPRELRLVVRRALAHAAVEAERQRLVTELERSCERARREAVQKTRLLTMAAHELGTPVHLLANALELLASTTLTAAAAPWLATAQRAADWLGRAVAQVSRGAHVAPRQLELRCRPLAIGTLLQTLHADFAAALAQRDLHLEVRVEDEVPMVRGDPLWLRRALANLLSNAVRFTPDGGCISMTARAALIGVEVMVTDTGVGIDASLHEHVFEPFSDAAGDVLLHTSGWPQFGSRGLGLGLAIAKAVIDQHGGQIVLESAPGRGSCFTCRLPCA